MGQSFSLAALDRTEGRDKSAARTTVGGEFPTLALSIGEVGASFPHGPRFRRPPCDPGRWDFPSPVLTLASRRSPSLPGEASVLTHIHPCTLWFASPGAPLFPGPTCPGTPGAAKCPEPLCTSKALPRSSWSLGPVNRHYPAVFAPTGSCASPQPSSCLGGTLEHRSVQVAVSPCWEKDLPDVVSAHLSLRAWTPTPVALEVLVPVSSPTTSAFPPFGPGRRSTKSVQRLQHGALFEAAVIR